MKKRLIISSRMKADGWKFHRLFVILLCWVCFLPTVAQDYYYWVGLKDKQATPHVFSKPETFLSPRAISRRARQGIAIDSADLPVSPVYVNKLKALGLMVRDTSRWLNGVIVTAGDAHWVELLMQQGYVREAALIKTPLLKSVSLSKGAPRSELKSTNSEVDLYGAAYDQLSMLNGQALHDVGYKGDGMHIAVIDNGFLMVNRSTWSEGLQILGTRDFFSPGSNVFEGSSHGSTVLSVMAGVKSDAVKYMGAAPEAAYWLLRTEDAVSESPLEPDLWVCAAEFADSAGVDVIQSSLGYFTFDDPLFNYSYADLNGSTRISRAANMAVDKGMVVVVSAGNEGDKSWKYITVPGDAANVLSVGSVRSDLSISSFSGWGSTPDGRIKPDVVARGEGVAMILPSGDVAGYGTGTSYAAPIIGGLAACLWQSRPQLKSHEVVEAIRASASRQPQWDVNRYGYGVPDFGKAWFSTQANVALADVQWMVWPNPFSEFINVSANGVSDHLSVMLTIYNSMGTRVWQERRSLPTVVDGLGHLGRGVYVLTIDLNHQIKTIKLIKP